MSAKSETGLGILFSDLALQVSLNFTWNWSLRLYDSSDFNNVYRFESCRRYSWTWPIGFWGRGMQIKGENQQIHGPYRGLTYSITTMWHYWQWRHKRGTHMSHEKGYTRFCCLHSDFERTTVDLMRLKFVGYDRACDLHQFLKNLSKKENVGAKISYWAVQVWYFSSAKAQRTVLYTREQ